MRDERNRLLVGLASGCCMMILPLLGIAIGSVARSVPWGGWPWCVWP